MKSFLFLCLLYASLISAQDLLIFQHIPKCGGTTIASLLGEKFHQDHIFHFLTPKSSQIKFLVPSQLDLEKTQYVHGHFWHPQPSDFPNAKIVTFLRHPIERVMSHYRYVTEHKTIEFSSFYPEISNLQVRFLSGLPIHDPTIPIEKHLESAKKNLEQNFFFVGIVEEMEVSLQALYALLDWEELPMTPQFNPSRLDHKIEPLKETIAKKEWADIELYAFAKKLFHEKFLPLSQKSICSQTNWHYTNQISFTGKDPLVGSGWGYRETDPHISGVFRQSYKENSSLFFPLLAENYQMQCDLLFPSKKTMKNFQIFINGHPLLKKPLKGKKKISLEATIPKKWIRENSPTEIIFHISPLFSPGKQRKNKTDHRSLGVGILEIKFTPFVKNKGRFERVKASQFADWKWPHIKNIGPLPIDEFRQLSRSSNSPLFFTNGITPIAP